jgi:hypothetical protein
MTDMTTVDELLCELAEMFLEKNKLYDEQYASFGETMMTLLGPIEIKTAKDYSRYMTVFNMVTKIKRYCNMMKKGSHHPDSLDDLAIYSQMLRRLDLIWFDDEGKQK